MDPQKMLAISLKIGNHSYGIVKTAFVRWNRVTGTMGRQFVEQVPPVPTSNKIDRRQPYECGLVGGKAARADEQ
jgi:hypothetical protein